MRIIIFLGLLLLIIGATYYPIPAQESVLSDWEEVKPEESPHPAHTPTVPADWLRFTHKELLYSFRYPEGWEILDQSSKKLDKLLMIYPEGKGAILTIQLDARTFDKIHSDYLSEFPDSPSAEVTFAGQTAQIYRPTSDSLEVFVPNRGRIFHLSTEYMNEPEIQQILSSFEFTK